MKKQKVFIVGAGGQVGSSAAYAMAIKQTIQEIVLIDLHPDIANGYYRCCDFYQWSDCPCW